MLGLLGVFVCAFCAPFAFVQARKAEREINVAPGAYGGAGMVTAGKVLGIIGSVLLALGVVLFVLWLIFVVIVGVSSA